MIARNVVADLPAWEVTCGSCGCAIHAHCSRCLLSRSQVTLFEVVRQCFVHCEERGTLLERIRARYLHLREEVLGATNAGTVFWVVPAPPYARGE